MTTPFDSLDHFISLPRIEGLALSPDGTRVVLTVATLSADRTAYERSLWEVPGEGDGEPVRLTRSAKGETGAAFTADGDLLFSSARPDGEDDEVAQLWLLPRGGGEARCVSRLAGGVSGIASVASQASTAVLAASLMPSADTLEDDARVRAERKKKSVSAIMHAGYPVRFWDHDLGPALATYLTVDLAGLPAESAAAHAPEQPADADGAGATPEDTDAVKPYPSALPRPRELSRELRGVGDQSSAAVSPDGTTVVAAVEVPGGVLTRSRLVSVDVASGAVRALFDEDGQHVTSPAISPDGTRLAFAREDVSTPAGCSDVELWVSDLDGSNARQVAPQWDRWASSLSFSANGRALVVTADDDGRAPIFLIDLEDDEVVRLTLDDYAYANVAVDHSSGGLVALRSSLAEPPHPVRIDDDGAVTLLPTPAPTPETVAVLTDVDATAPDGARVRGWLLTPPDATAAEPAPLLVWIHGGPLGSWNAWTWRWNAHLAVARGYAVLMPDPALSTGYGMDFIQRGWNSWGDKPYTDLMAITDAVVERPEIDEGRTAAMGGSFGGYMANWVAGHTDRFDAIVTHASLWAFDQFGGTTDMSGYWQSIFTPEAAAQNSPHQFVQDIVSPMLVIHGDKDYRVPIGEGLRLWSDLNRVHGQDQAAMKHRFLYFPDENHWILSPQHAVVWYQTVFAFLAEHVLGEESELPATLG